MLKGELVSFVIDWKKKLGYSKDPFMDLKVKPKQLLVSRSSDQEQLNLFIIKHKKIALITGEKGIGKSLLLNWLREQLNHNFKLLFLDNQKIISSNTLLFAHLLDGYTGVFDRVIKKSAEMSQEQKLKLLEQKLKKKSVLLIDDADKLSSKNQELLSYLLENTDLQLILTATKKEGLKLKPDIKLELSPLNEEEFEKLLIKRIALAGGVGIFPFINKDIKKLTKKSKGNPKVFLDMAKEEALELSLKVTELPKFQPQSQTSSKSQSNSESKKPSSQTKGRILKPKKDSWFTIKFAKDKDEKEMFIFKSDDKELEIVQATTDKNNKNYVDNKGSKKNKTGKDVRDNKTNNKNGNNNDSESDDYSDKSEEIHDFLQSLADEVDE